MTPGLVNTPLIHIQNLFAYVLIRGLKDRDTAWINSPHFETVCVYAGLHLNRVAQIRDLYHSGMMNFKALEWWDTGYDKPDKADKELMAQGNSN
jgi:hypothetical protein